MEHSRLSLIWASPEDQMPITVRCQHCNTKLIVRSRKAGQQVDCPKCHKRTAVPSFAKSTSPGESQGENLVAPMIPSAAAPPNIMTAPNATNADPIAPSQPALLPEFAVYDEPEVIISDESGAVRRIERQPIDFDRISIPRMVIYLQGALLGLVAISFFSLGWWLGQGAVNPQLAGNVSGTCQVNGKIATELSGKWIADSGAVVMFLPVDKRPNAKPDASLLQPGNQLTSDNLSVKALQEIGAAVVSTNEEGAFLANLKAGQSYYCFVLSNKGAPQSNQNLSKQLRADLGTYFTKAEDILRGRPFHLEKVQISGRQQSLKEIRIRSAEST